MQGEASHETDLTPLNFPFDAQNVRVVLRDGEPWFVASDVAVALGYRDASNAIRLLDDDEKGTQLVSTLGGPQDALVCNEPGLFRLILRSNRPEAKRFQKWVVSDVLPTIRKTGSYGAVPAATSATQLHALNKLAQDLRHELRAETDPQVRLLIHGQLRLCTESLRLPTPPLQAIGRDAPAVPEEVTRFWDAYRLLEGEGLRLNHAHDRALIAVNVQFVLARAEEHGLRLPLRELQRALRLSKDPAFHDVKVVRSVITRRSMWCWVFRAQQRPATEQLGLDLDGALH